MMHSRIGNKCNQHYWLFSTTLICGRSFYSVLYICIMFLDYISTALILVHVGFSIHQTQPQPSYS